MEDKKIGVVIALIVILVVSFFLFGYPMIRVWWAGQAGKAQLRHANFEREVQIVNAQANLHAQEFNAQSEVVRAEGIAKANNIIKDSITEAYIRYLWVQTLDRTNNQIIYVPLGQDGLPITEAGRAVK